jgi:hypothetical protein
MFMQRDVIQIIDCLNAYRLAMFQDVLYDVVPVLILKQGVDVGVELVEDEGGLFHSAMLKNTLDHATAVGMCGQGEDLEWKQR